jgi:hypothetical protein
MAKSSGLLQRGVAVLPQTICSVSSRVAAIINVWTGVDGKEGSVVHSARHMRPTSRWAFPFDYVVMMLMSEPINLTLHSVSPQTLHPTRIIQ